MRDLGEILRENESLLAERKALELKVSSLNADLKAAQKRVKELEHSAAWETPACARYRTERDALAKTVEGMKKDSDRLDALEALMRPEATYCEIYLAGLRSGQGGSFDATAYQVESSPERFPTVNAPTLREAIDKALTPSVPEAKEKP